MRILLFFSLFFLASYSANAQTEKGKERFAKRLFTDFKKNRLDLIVDQFVDSVFLDELLKQSKELQEEVSKKYSREKIHKQRKIAKERFRKSLERAYRKYTANNIEDPLSRVVPITKIYKKSSVPIETFNLRYQFNLDDKEAEIKISQIIYDRARKRFTVFSDRVRAYLLDTDLEVSTERIKKIESARLDEIDEEVKAPARSPQDVRTEPPMVAEPNWKKSKKTERLSNEVKEYEPEPIVIEKEEFLPPPPAPPYGTKQVVLQFVEQMPEFPGGQEEMMNYISKNIQYPELARDNGIQGKVYIKFIVGEDGTMRDIEVIKGIGGGCDEEAVRVLKRMPKWKPGKQSGKTVPVSFTLPFSFKLK